jgi:Protein of unknown function (DUF2911)
MAMSLQTFVRKSLRPGNGLFVVGMCLAGASLVPAQNQERKSPHDTVSAQLGGKTITITYGRPYMKGRQVFGHDLVPYGEVWRTGADEATKLTTDADLMINDTRVPKGTYSLFTVPDKTKWTLVINKTADQWGAFNYNQSQDLGRTPMEVKSLPSPVEQFTMTLKPQGSDAVRLEMAWENTQAGVTMRLAK